MSHEQTMTNDPKNSENEKKNEEPEEEKSEEYLNFESLAKEIFSMPPEEAKKIRERTPQPRKGS